MWDKWVVRTLAAVYILGGVATLVTPERMGRFARWFADNPLCRQPPLHALGRNSGHSLGCFSSLKGEPKGRTPAAVVA
jgi:hypothetical protein